MEKKTLHKFNVFFYSFANVAQFFFYCCQCVIYNVRFPPPISAFVATCSRRIFFSKCSKKWAENPHYLPLTMFFRHFTCAEYTHLHQKRIADNFLQVLLSNVICHYPSHSLHSTPWNNRQRYFLRSTAFSLRKSHVIHGNDFSSAFYEPE